MSSNSVIKKIIFLYDNLFCKRDYDRFGIEILEANGFEVLVWELTPIINPNIYNNIAVPDPIEYKGYNVFSKFSDIRKAILSLGNDCFFIIISEYCPKLYPALRSISRRKIPYCFELSGSCVPILSDYVNAKTELTKDKITLLKIIDKFKKINYELLKKYVFLRLPYKLMRLRPADFIIAGGAKSNIHLYRVPSASRTKILNIHYYDYDNYISEISKGNIIDQATVVFLDQYVPLHPENLLSGCSSEIKVEEYYPYLRKFFDYLEATFKAKIIIAAHPRAHYDNGEDYFGGRPVIRNKTCELVGKAGLVLAHHSFSMNYAVLFNKPILFLTTEEMQKSKHGTYINLMATILGKTPIFIDRPYNIDWEKEIIVDYKKYYEYKQNHIKMEGTEELPFWQVVANNIKSNY